MRLFFTMSVFSFANPEVLRSVALKRRHKRYVACDGVVRGNMPKALKAFGTAVSRSRLRFNRLVIHTAFFYNFGETAVAHSAHGLSPAPHRGAGDNGAGNRT